MIGAYLAHRSVRVAPHTLRVDGNHLEVFGRFLTARRITLLRELRRALLDDLLAWLLRPGAALHGGQRKPQSANRIAGAALLLWQWADSDRYPDAPRAPRELDLAPSVAPLVVAPTWAEMDACIEACRGWQRQLATWLRYTGLRVGESVLLRWEHIDVTGGLLTIPAEIDKNRIGRTIPLHPALLDEIATWGKREGYVVPVGRSARIDSGRDLRRPWKRAGVREVAYAGHPAHAFRRGFKTGLVAAGANADAVDWLQGHSLGAGSRGRYIDGSALPLAETLAMVPAVRVPGVSPEVVVALPQRR